MASENLNPEWNRTESLKNVRELLEEIDENLDRKQGMTGMMVTDKQTERILRALRILTDEVERLGSTHDVPMGGGIEVSDVNDRPWEP